jgi:uncharacterized membrane protein
MQFLQHKLLNRFFICIYFKTLPIYGVSLWIYFRSPIWNTRSTISCSISCTSPPSVPSFIIALISRLLYCLLKVVFYALSKNSVECVNNHIKGAVMIETIFIGMATALQLLRDDSTLFALAIILQHQREKSISPPQHPRQW